MPAFPIKTSSEDNLNKVSEVTERELEQPLNRDWRYDSRWMADPQFRTWLVWQRRQGRDV